jgi:LytS/YehU family sensor histidine kinase
MLRKMLADADRTYRTLEEELEFVRTYLDMEKLRFGDKFTYRIHTGKEVTGKEPVPVLCIQTFAENSIRHGLMPLEKGGVLTVSAERSAGILIIRIEDNGVGREKAAQLNPHVGRGLRIISDFFEVINQSNTGKATYTITDLLLGNGLPAGTRVEISLPQVPSG